MIIDYVFENLSDLNFIQMELYLTQLKSDCSYRQAWICGIK